MNDETPFSIDPATPAPAAAVGATPMMEQFIEIKAANPDSLLFYRMGDFYELFFQDAEVASRALGIALTKRGKHLGRDIPMCGVPIHAADDYLQKLIALGHRVAVCEQIEDPAEARKRGAKSVVRRDVVRLVTPGTITEDRLLAPSEANYLMALGRVKGAGGAGCALAWIDISTGAFRVAETAPDRLAADVMRVDPKELVVAEPAFHDPELRPAFDLLGRIVHPQPPSLFDSASAARPHRPLLRRRHARQLRHLLARRAGGHLGRHRLCREDAEGRAAAAGAARPRGRCRHAVRRPGDARQPRTAAHHFRQPRRRLAEGHRPHRDRRRRAAARRTPHRPADRPGGHSPPPRLGRPSWSRKRACARRSACR